MENGLPKVIGTGSLVDWTDNGPPKTEIHPSTQSKRYYRVVFAP